MTPQPRPDWIRLCFWLGVACLVVYALMLWAGICPP